MLLLQQARFTNPLTHPHARLVTARRVEPGELPAVAPRQLTITAATGPASVPQEDKTGSAAKESRAQKVVLNTIVYKKQKAYYLAPEVCERWCHGTPGALHSAETNLASEQSACQLEPCSLQLTKPQTTSSLFAFAPSLSTDTLPPLWSHTDEVITC